MNEASHRLSHLMEHLPAEPAVAIVLSLSGVLTSWAGYQASLWDGEQFAHYSRAEGHRVAASQVALDTSMLRAVEVGLFRAWVEAKARDDDRLAGFYEARFPPDLRAAFPHWLAQRPLQDPDAAPSPFSLPSYRPRGVTEAAALEAKAEQAFQAALDAKHTADAHERAAVVLASAMFFGGIGQVFKRASVRMALLAVSILSLGLGASQVLSLPTLSLGGH